MERVQAETGTHNDCSYDASKSRKLHRQKEKDTAIVHNAAARNENECARATTRYIHTYDTIKQMQGSPELGDRES